jgi:hypothetical protein
MANLSTEPTQLAGARRCGAKTRGARGGRPCRAPAMANGRCRMHGGRSGGPTGSRNGAFRHGKYSRETKELGRMLRELARAGEAMVATTMNRVGLKPLKAIRRKAHVKRALAKAQPKGQEQ